MDHNQTVIDTYLTKYLATNRITASDLHEAINAQLNPTLDLADFNAIKEWFINIEAV
jgi:hypothetical protein